MLLMLLLVMWSRLSRVDVLKPGLGSSSNRSVGRGDTVGAVAAFWLVVEVAELTKVAEGVCQFVEVITAEMMWVVVSLGCYGEVD
jgi:hypothetical protein